MRRFLSLLISSLLLAISLLVAPQASWAYPFWAQQNYDNPREATGKIVCANCHLAKKLTQVEVPQAVMPNTVFKAVVKIPYDTAVQQVAADGSRSGLNVGAVVMLPDGFVIAPQDRLTEELKEETKGIYYTQYSDSQPNILLVGPLPGDEHREIVFPILSPDPASDSSIHFGKYQLHIGGNRGRGQVYPTGEKSNNGVFNASVSGHVSAISSNDKGGSTVSISAADGSSVETRLNALAAAGHPVIELNLNDPIDLGGEFMRWEIATAIAGVVLGINPFDEPNVTESKNNTVAVLGELAAAGRLPELTPKAVD
ncbi:MAG: apocytochrome f, partial [Synechococcaceae bacterium WB9_3_282]|nr:apocytochrome f [Synechococcaceae bacterium WB9_3_282]